jgi:hypothetical protein
MSNKSYDNKNLHAIVYAYNKGYRVLDGNVISPNGNERKIEKTRLNNGLRFNIRGDNRRFFKIRVSLLVAYQKFKDKIFEPETTIYHIDGDITNNKSENIAIAKLTPQDIQYSRKGKININN